MNSSLTDDGMNPHEAIQGVFRGGSVAVAVLGELPASERKSLVMVAGQALRANIQGFAFQGVRGKFLVDLNLGQVQGLYSDAAGLIAEESVMRGVASWLGGKRPVLSNWVPGSIERLVSTDVTVEGVEAVVDAIRSGAVRKHGTQVGFEQAKRLLLENGLDPEKQTIHEFATERNFTIIEKPVDKGRFVGQVLAVDHSGALLKTSRDKCIIVPFVGLDELKGRPGVGDVLNVRVVGGLVKVTVPKAIATGVER